MNERACEVLVAAALRGVRQIKYALRDQDGGMCAGGVLVDALINETPGAQWNSTGVWGGMIPSIGQAYDISSVEWSKLVHHNNIDGWDFLTIARKMGPGNQLEQETTT